MNGHTATGGLLAKAYRGLYAALLAYSYLYCIIITKSALEMCGRVNQTHRGISINGVIFYGCMLISDFWHYVCSGIMHR